MPKTIVRQKAELYFGDEYETVRRRTKALIKKLFNTMPLAPSKDMILSGEGGAASLLDTALAYTVDYNTVEEGWDAFVAYLRKEYDYTPGHYNSSHHSNWEYTLDDENEYTPLLLVDSAESASSNVLALSKLDAFERFTQSTVTSFPELFDDVLLHDEERELFDALAASNYVYREDSANQFKNHYVIEEACKLLDWDKKLGQKIYKRVRQRLRRRVHGRPDRA